MAHPWFFTREFTQAVLREVHDRHCHDRRAEHVEWCAPRWVRHQGGWADAVRHLQAHPRDARGARRIMHDRTCSSGAECDTADDHARTQTKNVAALRKVLATYTGPTFRS
jgi:hypothetical protein